MNYLLDYKIVAFNEKTGQIEIECDKLQNRISIDLPIDNGKYPEGDDLDTYIRGFIPTWTITRSERINKVTNAEYIKNLVQKSDKSSFDLRRVYSIRAMLLNQSDWTQLPDSPLTESQKKKWAKYRQELRDITNKPLDENMVWPSPPKILSTISFTK